MGGLYAPNKPSWDCRNVALHVWPLYMCVHIDKGLGDNLQMSGWKQEKNNLFFSTIYLSFLQWRSKLAPQNIAWLEYVPWSSPYINPWSISGPGFDINIVGTTPPNFFLLFLLLQGIILVKVHNYSSLYETFCINAQQCWFAHLASLLKQIYLSFVIHDVSWGKHRMDPGHCLQPHLLHNAYNHASCIIWKKM